MEVNWQTLTGEHAKLALSIAENPSGLGVFLSLTIWSISMRPKNSLTTFGLI